MTNEQHPGGVAGRVINELLGNDEIGGAQMMCDALSREARAMTETPNVYVPYQESIRWACEPEYQRGFKDGLQAAFTRLGLWTPELEDAE